MNKSLLFLFTLIMVPALGFCQNNEKVKGSRNVTIENSYIDDFNKIIVGEDFSVEIIYNSRPSVEIEADDNLHQYIDFDVVDSVLTFRSTAKITSKRKLNIKVNYTNPIEEIETRDDGEIRSLTSLELGNAYLKTSGSSKAYLNIKSDDFRFLALDRSRVRLNITAKKSDLELSDNCKVEALINTDELDVKMYQRANADIEGTAKDTKITADNDSKFDGKNFTTENCDLVAEVDSEVHIEVTNKINIEAAGSSQIYLYSDPKINLDKFTDTAKLQKKVR